MNLTKFEPYLENTNLISFSSKLTFAINLFQENMSFTRETSTIEKMQSIEVKQSISIVLATMFTGWVRLI